VTEHVPGLNAIIVTLVKIPPTVLSLTIFVAVQTDGVLEKTSCIGAKEIVLVLFSVVKLTEARKIPDVPARNVTFVTGCNLEKNR